MAEPPARPQPSAGQSPPRPRLAYFSPLPPARSGIADYSAEILPHLAQMADLTLFSAEPQAVDNRLHEQFDIYPLHDYARLRWRFDLPVYQMGANVAFHEEIDRLLRRYPGLVALHDVNMHHYVAHRTLAGGNAPAYTRELGYALGASGVNTSWAVRHGERKQPAADQALHQRILDLSLGVLVHSRHALDLVRASRPRQPAWVAPLPVAVHEPHNAAVAELPWRDDAIVFASVGQITAHKRIDRALAAFARLRKEMPRARYLLVGELFDKELHLSALLDEHKLADDVYVTGFVPDLSAFMAWLARAHVVVNLREPTVGETSAAALRALSAARPLIVYDHGWYAELPDEIALKVPVLRDEALLAAMRRLGLDETLRREMGDQAHAYIVAHHHPAQTAHAYMQAITAILAPYG